MNYLIGLSLTQKNYQALIGGLLYSRYGNDETELNHELLGGIKFYKELEELFLSSESFQKSASRLSFVNRKHARTIISLFYDHFMARQWQDYNAGTSLPSDMNEFYKTVMMHKPLIPARAKKKFGRIRKYKLFENIANLNGIQLFAYQLNRNDAYHVIIQNSLTDFMAGYELFKKDFEEFMMHCLNGKYGLSDPLFTSASKVA